jgi:O-antigen/teichoic acid export membrane protein
MKSSYCNIIKIVTSINIPILVIVGALSYPIVAIVYGERYLEIAPLVSILALAYIGNCICFPVGNVIIPTGRTDLAFYYTIVRLIIVIPVVCAFSMMGLTALTWGRTIVNFIIIFISWYIEIWQIIKLRLIKLLHSFVSNLIIGVICGILGYFVVKYNSLNIHTGIAQLLIYTLLTLSFYVALQFFFNKKENVELFELVGARTLKKKPV